MAQSCEILLSSGCVALVSVEDYVFLTYYNWHGHGEGYAQTRIGKTHVLMHTLIAKRMGITTKMVDHKDENRLNNQRENLRATDCSLNGANRGKQANNTSGYKGVHVLPDGRIRAYIRHNRVTINLGTHATLEKAAIAYNNAAIRVFGDHAKLNEVPDHAQSRVPTTGTQLRPEEAFPSGHDDVRET